MLELRFMPANAEIQNGDRLVTSGIDGTYPAGLPVATVVEIERDPENTFARFICRPAAGGQRGPFLPGRSAQAPPAARPYAGPAGQGRPLEESRPARRHAVAQ